MIGLLSIDQATMVAIGAVIFGTFVALCLVWVTKLKIKRTLTPEPDTEGLIFGTALWVMAAASYCLAVIFILKDI